MLNSSVLIDLLSFLKFQFCVCVEDSHAAGGGGEEGSEHRTEISGNLITASSTKQ